MMQEENMVCSRCGAVIEPGHEVYVEGEIICDDCADDETFICERCGERFWNEDNCGDSDISICHDCYHDYYLHCVYCNALIHEDDAYYDDGDRHDRECPCCRDCYNRLEHGKIHNYGYKPEPIFFGDGPLFLGVELEVDRGGQSNKNAARILDIMNVHDEHAYIKSDGSLDDGMELVSHPCTLEYHMESVPWEDALTRYRELGYYSHSAGTCGLHVHVSRAALGETEPEQEETIGKILYLFERFWQEILKFSRRTESQMNHWAARYGYKDSGHEILKSAKQTPNGRYSCVNLLNEETVEFRAFRGTLKYNTFIATLQFVANLCKVAFSVPESDLQQLCWPDFVRMISVGNVPELVQYLKERNLYVNEPLLAEREV